MSCHWWNKTSNISYESYYKSQSSKNNNNIVEWATEYIKNPPDCSTRFGDMSCFLEIDPHKR